MAALLGRDEHGCWTIYPGRPFAESSDAIGPGTVILETDYECDGGKVRFIDFMPLHRGLAHAVVRIVQGLEGSGSQVTSTLMARFGYGHYTPWVTKKTTRCC